MGRGTRMDHRPRALRSIRQEAHRTELDRGNNHRTAPGDVHRGQREQARRWRSRRAMGNTRWKRRSHWEGSKDSELQREAVAKEWRLVLSWRSLQAQHCQRPTPEDSTGPKDPSLSQGQSTSETTSSIQERTRSKEKWATTNPLPTSESRQKFHSSSSPHSFRQPCWTSCRLNSNFRRSEHGSPPLEIWMLC